MKLINTEDAVGHILCHDITQIIKGVTKDARFRKGHVVTAEDIPVLLSLGKEHLYIWEKQAGMLHENEAAQMLYGLCKNENMCPSAVKEGKIDVLAQRDGLFQVDVARLAAVNALGDVMIAARHNHFPVKAGDKLAGTRVIPLVIAQGKLEEARRIAGDTPLMQLLPYRHKKVGVVTTGNEVFSGRIQDTFGPVVEQKLKEYDITWLGQKLTDDDPVHIAARIQEFLDEGAELVVCTGGMSVDPDDCTPAGIKATGAEIISYGAPTLPGAMFLLAYYRGNIPVLGLPGCVMYAKRTIFDLILPRLMADEPVTKADLAALGHGGLCLNCEPCHYPNCSFGKA